LAKDFPDTCIVAEHDKKIIAFSSGYIPPARPDTFFNWESVVHQDYRGNGLQLRMFLYQIKMSNSKYFEGTVNPSNEASKNNLFKLAWVLNAKCEEKVLFSEEDFDNDGHEAEVLFTIGPIEYLEKINPEIINKLQF
jgi:L-2,4-diaminobutyric acid acetyltransferase